MEIGFSGEAFGNLLVLNALILVLFVPLIFYVSHRRGIDITTRRFQLTVGVICLIVFVVVPLLLSDLSIKWKIIASILSVSAGIGNYFAVCGTEQIIKKHLWKKK